MQSEGASNTQSINKRQLFVRNLSFNVNEEKLTKLFEEIGPLKNVSVPKKHDGSHTGFGFVKFALEEDCATAIEKFQGHVLDGRAVSLEYFVKKVHGGKLENPSLKEISPKEQIAEVSAPVSKFVESDEKNEEGDDTPHIRHSRQVVVYGVPIDVNKKIFKSALGRLSKNVTVEMLKQDSELSELAQVIFPVGKVFLLTAPSRPDAQKLASTINSTNLNNLGFGKFQATTTKSTESDHSDVDESPHQGLKLENLLKDKMLCRLVSDITPSTLRKKKCRVIIRNLSFQATERNILDKLKKFGPITEIDLPRKTVEVGKKEKITKEKPKGFSFVTFLCGVDAKAATESSGGIKICNREVAIDLCLSKTAFEKYGKLDATEKGDMSVTSPDESSSEIEEGGDSSSDEDEDDEEEDSSSRAKTQEHQTEKKSNGDVSSDVSEGRTVFVHGISFDTATDHLRSSFSVYGEVELVIIVKDKVTGMSKGSAFVKFREKESVDRLLLEISRRDAANKNTVDINNRKCFVNIAVSKSDLDVLKSSKQLGKDKRNLYLSNEGINITGQSDTVMSKQDKEKRAHAQAEKKKKLQNPIFFISNKRLSIRNLSKKVSNHDLKIACLKAVKRGLVDNHRVAVDDLKQQIIAEGLNALQNDGLNNGGAQMINLNSLALPQFDSRKCITSAKIMYDENKIRDGKPQSRGYAFVEFTNHIYALAALRELNNNPEYDLISAVQDTTDSNEKGRLIVEFTVENIRKVKILNERKERVKERSVSKAMEVALDDLGGETVEVDIGKKRKKSINDTDPDPTVARKDKKRKFSQK